MKDSTKRSWYWDKGVYWFGMAVVVALWLFQWPFGTISWEHVALGFGTGVILTALAIEITGNKPPSSWRRKPPR